MPVFLKNLVKTLLDFWYFCYILSVLTLILARKLLFRKEKYALQDSLKFNTIQRSNEKVNFLTIPSRVLVIFFVKFTIQTCYIYFCPFWLWNSRFYTFSIFFWFFGLCFDLWIQAGQNAISTIHVVLFFFFVLEFQSSNC